MALVDHGKAQQEKEAREKYEELKKLIGSKETGELNEYYPALRHLLYLESKIKKQEEKIKEYENFFSLLQKFLPRKSSITDILG